MNSDISSNSHSSLHTKSSKIDREIIPMTTNGNPAYWESGGASSSTGEATIVTDRHYQKLKPLYIKRKGRLSNYNHALLPINKGYKIIKAKHHNDDFVIKVFEVLSIDGDIANLELIATYANECQKDWKGTLSEDAVRAVVRKAKTYHCRIPYYISN